MTQDLDAHVVARQRLYLERGNAVTLRPPADGGVGRRQKSLPFRLPKWTDGSAEWKTSDPFMKTFEELKQQLIVIQ